MDKNTFKEIRKAANWNQQRCADYLGVKLRTVKGYEYGEWEIPAPVAKLMNLIK